MSPRTRRDPMRDFSLFLSSLVLRFFVHSFFSLSILPPLPRPSRTASLCVHTLT